MTTYLGHHTYHQTSRSTKLGRRLSISTTTAAEASNPTAQQDSESFQSGSGTGRREQMFVEPYDEYTQPPPGWREWLFIAILCSTQFFVQGTFGYILLPLSIVGETFGQNRPSQSTMMSWHVAGYSLTVGTFILTAGKLGDTYGSKNVLLLGWVWFGVWSIICGCSVLTGSAIFFDTARAFQAIGPAVLLPNALAVAGRTYPPGRKKNAIFALFTLAAPLGCLTAGAVGAVFAQYVWWPWTVWIYARRLLHRGCDRLSCHP